MRKRSKTLKPASGMLRSLYVCAALSTAGLGAGCGANLATAPAIHRAGPEGGRNLSTLTPPEMAFGTRTQDHQIDSQMDLSRFLKPETEAPVEVAVAAKPQPRLRTKQTPVVAAAAVEEEPAIAASPAPVQETAPLVVADLSTTQPTSQDAELYAQREAQSQSQQEYRGGDVLVISASTIVIVLLIALLVVLLT